MEPRIQHIIELWYLSEGALFQIINTHNIVINERISCVFRSGKGKIEYNPNIIKELSDKELEAYLKAEAIRILLKHPYERQPSYCKRESMAIGSNLVLADNYDFSIINLPKPKDYGLQSSESYELYSYRVEEGKFTGDEGDNAGDTNGNPMDNYESSKDKITSKSDITSNIIEEETSLAQYDRKTEQNSNKEEDDFESFGGNNGDEDNINLNKSKSKDNPANNSKNETNTNRDLKETKHEKNQYRSDEAKETLEGVGKIKKTKIKNRINSPDLTSNWEEDSLMICNINVAIEQIKQNSAWGSLAGNIANLILANTKAKIDYRKILAGFRATILSSKRQLTRMRPNRRSGFENMGSIRRFSTNLLVAIDVSGSIEEVSLKHFYSIINRTFRYGIEKIDVLQFDTKISDIQTFAKAQKEIKISGRGGTNFQPIFDFTGKHSEYDGLIIFTDGYAPIPKIPKGMHCKILWVCDTENNYEENKEWMKDFGRCCYVEL